MCSAPVVRLDSEFDAFLYAPVGEGSNGVLLSVISALVRLDLDPWAEAAELAQLPAKKAAERLASAIATLPDEAVARSGAREMGAREIADRLVGLLPRQGGIRVPAPPSVKVLMSSRTRVIAVCAAILVCVLVAQSLFAGLGGQTSTIGATAPTGGSVVP